MIDKGDYRFRDDLYNKDAGETVPIEILTGPYKNVIYRYVKVGIKEKDDSEAVLQFIYDLLETGDHFETALRKDQRFTNHIGIILNHLVLESAEADVNDARENNSEKSTEQRGLLP